MVYNRAILMAIRPEWLEKILNGWKLVEIRKLFPKDYVGCGENACDIHFKD